MCAISPREAADYEEKKRKGWLPVEAPAHVSTPTRFELARAEPIGFQNQLLNHSDTVSPAWDATAEFSTGQKPTTPTRFELWRAEPNRFLIYLLNHSDTMSLVRFQTERIGAEV